VADSGRANHDWIKASKMRTPATKTPASKRGVSGALVKEGLTGREKREGGLGWGSEEEKGGGGG